MLQYFYGLSAVSYRLKRRVRFPPPAHAAHLLKCWGGMSRGSGFANKNNHIGQRFL